MQVVHAKPYDKGVTRLMYVGDDGIQGSSSIRWGFLALVGVVVYLSFAFDKKR